MQVFLKTLTGKTISLDIEQKRETITALDIKKLIQAQEGIPIEEQVIVSCGATWQDGMTELDVKHANPKLKDVGLDETLHLVVKKALIPEHLRSIVTLDYKALTVRSSDLACEISQGTRLERYSCSGHPDTETYWNNLRPHERVRALDTPACIRAISSISQETELSGPRERVFI